MNEQPSPLDLLAEEIGAVAGQLKRENNFRITAAIADLQRKEAERELRFSKLERQIEERLVSIKDGVPGRDGLDGKNGIDGNDGVDGAPGEKGELGERGPPGIDGKDGINGRDGLDGQTGADGLPGTPGDPGQNGKDGVDGRHGEAGSDGRDGEDGQNGAPGEKGERGETGERGAVGERGDPGPMGSLPEVRAWADEVHYRAAIVAHAGSLYQAARDTAKEPPHADWVCLAAGGRDGTDGRSFTIRGTFQESGEYRELDVVSLNGASFVAKRNDPGACPGEGWQLMAVQGGRGKPGDRGIQGPKAERGTKVEALSIDDDGVLSLRHEDGSVVTCDLYPLLSKLT